MRPVNFPTIRIAQFAALVHHSLHLFSNIIEIDAVNELELLLQVSASPYWDNHFILDEISGINTPKKMGKNSIQNIIINTLAPIKFLYAFRHGNALLQEKALDMLSEINAEKNKIISHWQQNKWIAENAAQSQALLQLHNAFCMRKKCLECAIGLNIIRSAPI
jgi:hypothetical protein